MEKRIRIAINGFGRIGRTAFKIAFEKPGLEVVAVNDISELENLAYLLRYDTVYGSYERRLKAVPGGLLIDGKRKVRVLAEREPAKLPWKRLKIDVVLECTGRFTNTEAAAGHAKAGAQRVIISAPVHGDAKTFLLGANAEKYGDEIVISNASCTTNCIAPIARIMSEKFGVRKAMMTTIHAVTAEQSLVDGPSPALHHDFRRGRAGIWNIVPTTTGAATAVAKVVAGLDKKFDGLAIRVPVLCGSLADFTFLLKKKTNVASLNRVLTKAAQTPPWKGIIEVSHEPLVSSDILRNPASAIVDLTLTKVVDGDLVKVVAWYDNEWGYANRLIELAEQVGHSL